MTEFRILLYLASAAGLAFAGAASAQPTPLCTAGCSPSKPVVATSISACQATPANCPAAQQSVPRPFQPLKIWTSRNRTLAGTLTAAPACISGLPNFQGPQNVFNGSVLPPVWYLDPGDAIDLTVTNSMDLSDRAFQQNPSTNLHYHGLNVPPNNFAGQKQGDSVFVVIPPKGGSYEYDIPIPLSHPRGMFWYHPHPHEVSEPQLLGGMSGAMIVRGLISTYYPSLLPVLGTNIPDNGGSRFGTEQVFLLKDYVPCVRGNWTGCAQKYVNGVRYGTMQVKPGVQFWRFANAGADQFYKLQLVDAKKKAQDLYIIGVDGNPATSGACPAANGVATACPIRVQTLEIPPGGRLDVLVQLKAGTYALNDLGTFTGPVGDPNCPTTLGSIRVAGSPGPSFNLSALQGSVPIAGRPSLDALRKWPPCNGSPATVAFTETGGSTFTIDGKAYDPARVDKVITNAPCVAQWTVTNDNPGSQENHVFHIHQTDFIVTGVTPSSDQSAPFIAAPGYQDTVTVPFGGSVTVLIPFTPDIAGYFVYHCHILNHEDLGMMANICVQGTGPGQQCAAPPPYAPAHQHP
jgi:suppressor of ftsI